MNLFNIHKTIELTNANPLQVLTPLGDIIFKHELINDSLDLTQIKNYVVKDSEIFLSCLYDKSCEIEFVRLKFIPKLPISMVVNNCICGIWRVRALHDIKIKVSCVLNSTLNIESSPESGEGLIANVFEYGNEALAIGSEDEDYLCIRTNIDGMLPLRLKNEIKAEHIGYLTNGIIISLPKILNGEEIQLHIICSWTTGEKAPISVWYAVDEPIKNILSQFATKFS